MMLVKIAWRNIWRNRRRSLIVILSIVVGVVGLMLNDSFGKGMMNEMLNNQIETHYAHMQIYDKQYRNDKVIENRIENPNEISAILDEQQNVKHFSKRVEVFGLISSAANSQGVTFVAVEPEKEKKITNVEKTILKGQYLSGKDNEILISQELADQLEIETGDKVVGITNATDGSVVNELFRVVGIFRTNDSNFDKTHIYVPLKDMQRILEIGDAVTGFAVMLNNKVKIQDKTENINSNLPENTEAYSYRDLLPLIVAMIGMYEQSILAFYIIIGIAVLFGIINTMLMSVFERVQEFGVLMSLGMKKVKIFRMIMTEALFLGIIGSVIGVVIGLLLFIPLSNSGIDLSLFSESMQSFGLGSVIYPEMDVTILIYSLFTMPVATMIGAIYPAFKAVRLQPTDAMRYV